MGGESISEKSFNSEASAAAVVSACMGDIITERATVPTQRALWESMKCSIPYHGCPYMKYYLVTFASVDVERSLRRNGIAVKRYKRPFENTVI